MHALDCMHILAVVLEAMGMTGVSCSGFVSVVCLRFGFDILSFVLLSFVLLSFVFLMCGCLSFVGLCF